MSESCLTNQVRSCMLPYVLQIAEKASFFQLPYLEHDFMILQFSKIRFSFSENIGDVPVAYPCRGGVHYHVTSLAGNF